jgi:hypothetical protein
MVLIVFRRNERVDNHLPQQKIANYRYQGYRELESELQQSKDLLNSREQMQASKS